ncbi:BZ3500_MvSof-1268-A1-R1_Chr1-3g02341 [Microbotryum saponariae]|uniref:DNA 3'-5' helicase n=1 Tax=Microbotryum saponariae TaxID=289078 RepID=A0A2X0KQC4_9BASI|nr:BZ3500_MvSof-1268-A1-R1_Chr1-3g02341 [Microbotryum saponariae]SCZ96042.1 BZ3501_MvSof-1269-A2-R1_Chr1-3g01944 [Microbotryum saponariae]
MASSSRFRFAPAAGTSAPTAPLTKASSHTLTPPAQLARADSRTTTTTTTTTTSARSGGQTSRVHKSAAATAAAIVVDPKGKARATPSTTTNWLVKPEPEPASSTAAACYHNNPVASISKRAHAQPLDEPVATSHGRAHVITSTSTTSSSTPQAKTVHASLPPIILGRHKSSNSSHTAHSTASPHFVASRPSAAPAPGNDGVATPAPPPPAPRPSTSSKVGMTATPSRLSSPPPPSRQRSSRGEKRSQNDPAQLQLESDEIQPADENHDPFRPSASKRSRASLDSGYGAGDRTNHETQLQMHGFELVAPTPTFDEPIICDSEGEECEPLTSEADIPTPSTASEKAHRHRLVEAATKAERAKMAPGSSSGAAPVTSVSNEPVFEIVERDLVRLTNRRIALLEECLELLNSGATFTESGSDEPMLRNNLNYVAEKTQEQRATLLARGRSLSQLQLMLEKRASLLNELIDIRTNAMGVSVTGSDRGFVEHQLVYVNSRINDLRAQAGVTGVTTPRAVASPAPTTLGTSSNHSTDAARSTRASARSGIEVVPNVSTTPLPSLSLSDPTIVQPPPPQPQPRLSVGTDVVSGPSMPNSSGSCSSLNSATSKIHAPRPAAAKVTSFRPAPNPATNIAPVPAPAPAAMPTPTTASVSRPILVLPSAPLSSDAVTKPPSIQGQPAGDSLAGPYKPPAPAPGRVAPTSRLNLQPAPGGSIASTSKTIVIEDDFAGINFDEPLTLDDDDDMLFVESTTSRRTGRAAPAGDKSDVDPALAIVAPRLNHPWSRDVAKALRQRFGLTGFRANQEEAINATLAGKDVFVLLPTGGGKSLCFQLPAVISTGRTKGVTIVVSPLLSLISDQTNALIEKDIPVVFLNSTMAAADRKFAMDAIRSDPPLACLAYVTPEQASITFLENVEFELKADAPILRHDFQIVKSDAFRSVLRELSRREQLARFVIDEAHCVSSWGHDFRPDYKEMGSLKKDFPRVPMIALTATANDRVKNDVMSNLRMQSPLVLTQSFNRKNLRYEVRPKGKGVINDIATLIRTNFSGKCGIIYCMSKKQCEDTAKTLRNRYQIGAQHYHAGMNKDDRLRIQEGWQHNEFHVICATIAFGMGIDKPDVRYVIHYSLSQSLEAYYQVSPRSPRCSTKMVLMVSASAGEQETGRAGRDGVTSTCILFFAYGDTKLINRLIDEGEGTVEQKENNRANVRRVVQYCMNETDCRRVQVLRYFGDNDFTAEMCHKTCDNCLAARNVEKRDVTEIAQDAIRLVQSIEREKGVTMLYAIDVFRGSKIAKITAKGHDQLPYAGKGAKMDRGDVERLFQLLASESALGERFERNALGFTNAYVTVGPKARELLSGSRKLEMGMSSTSHKRATTTTTTSTAAKAQKPIAAKYSNDFVDDLEDEDSGDDYANYAPGAGRDANMYDEIQNLTSPVASAWAPKHIVGATYASDIDAVLAQLINLRAETALAEDSEESQIISDDALQRVAANLPCSRAELALIPGCENEELFEWYLESGCRKVCSLARAARARPGAPAGPSKSKSMASTSCGTLTAVSSKEPLTKPDRAKARVSATNATKPTSKAKVLTGATKQMNIERFALGAAASERRPAGRSISNPRRGAGRSKESPATGTSGAGGGGAIRAMPILRR